jgi:hypothetical protein
MAEYHRLVLQETGSPASAARPAHESGVVNLNERRRAWDGEAYTFEEFATHYGFANGLAMWRSRDSAELPVGITAQPGQQPDSSDSAEQCRHN